MPLPTTVTLPKRVTPRWPERCISCCEDLGGGRMATTLSMWTHTIGWWTWVFWIFGKPHRTRDIPVCMRCKSRVRMQRWLRLLVSMVLLAAGGWLAFQILNGARFPGRRWVILGIAVIAMLPWLVWEIFFPQPLDVTAYADRVEYDFRERLIAEKFAQANGAEVDDD